MNFNDMSGMKQWGLVLAVAALLSAALYFTYFKSQRDANESAQKSLDAKLQRIVNVSNLLVANTKKSGEAKAKHTYQYAPNESVVATCMATTFFSHDQPVATPATAKGRI